MTARGRRILVLGGIRSGKSAHGEALLCAERSAQTSLRYIATGLPGSDDPAWQARLDAHRSRRDPRFATVETADLAAALTSDPVTPTLVDDLGTWLTRRIDALGWDSPGSGEVLAAELCAAVDSFTGDLVLISPEVGLSPVAETPAGRRIQDELGAVNRAVAQLCDEVLLVVAGRVMSLPDSTLTAAPEESAPSEPQSTVPIPAPPPAASTPAVSTPAADPTPEPVKPPPTPSTSTTPDLDPTDAEIFRPVDQPDQTVATEARLRQASLTKPAGSLGRLEAIGEWVASCQSQCPPLQFTDPTVVVFAGDHGVASNGVSAYPPEVTAQMVANIAAGGAAVNVMARRAGARVEVVDMSVDAETDPHVSRYKVRRSSEDLRLTDALTLEQARLALAAGRRIVDELVDAGADLLIAGEMGIGNTTPASILIGTVTGREPVEVVGRGTGIDDAGWIRKTAAIRDGMWRSRRHRHDPLSLLAAVAGADLTAMAGFLAQAAVRRTPVILDGVVVTAAALVAEQLAPGASSWWIAGHRSAEPAHTFALEHLDAEPIIDLSMRLGEGSAAVLALPIVASAVDLLRDMATFDQAGISDRD